MEPDTISECLYACKSIALFLFFLAAHKTKHLIVILNALILVEN